MKSWNSFFAGRRKFPKGFDGHLGTSNSIIGWTTGDIDCACNRLSRRIALLGWQFWWATPTLAWRRRRRHLLRDQRFPDHLPAAQGGGSPRNYKSPAILPSTCLSDIAALLCHGTGGAACAQRWSGRGESWRLALCRHVYLELLALRYGLDTAAHLVLEPGRAILLAVAAGTCSSGTKASRPPGARTDTLRSLSARRLVCAIASLACPQQVYVAHAYRQLDVRLHPRAVL
jgi:hypothetical protein